MEELALGLKVNVDDSELKSLSNGFNIPPISDTTYRVGSINDSQNKDNLNLLSEAQRKYADSLKDSLREMTNFASSMKKMTSNIQESGLANTKSSNPLFNLDKGNAAGMINSFSSGNLGGLFSSLGMAAVGVAGVMAVKKIGDSISGVITDSITSEYNYTQNHAEGNFALHERDRFGLDELNKFLSKIPIYNMFWNPDYAETKGRMDLDEKEISVYNETQPYMHNLFKAYGSNYAGTWRNNTQSAEQFFEAVVNNNQNTNLNNLDFIKLANSFSNYGLKKNANESDLEFAERIGKLTQSTANFAYNTNGDPSQYGKFVGLMGRYGDHIDLTRMFGASSVSGLTKNQFPEFLRSVEQIIEEGISKGFVKSSDEVAGTLAKFSLLSGNNPLWSGEQGAKRISQINNGLANATNLTTTSDILAFQVFDNITKNGSIKAGLDDLTYVNGGDWLNTMAMMEKGISADNYSDIMNRIEASYPGDIQSQVMAIKNLTGMNYTGAMQMYNMKNGSYTKEELEKKIADLSINPEYNSDEKNMQNIASDVNKATVRMGELLNEVKVAEFSKIRTSVDYIGRMIGETNPSENYANRVFQTSGFNITKNSQNYIKQLAKLGDMKGPDSAERKAFMGVMDFMLNNKEDPTLTASLENALHYGNLEELAHIGDVYNPIGKDGKIDPDAPVKLVTESRNNLRKISDKNKSSIAPISNSKIMPKTVELKSDYEDEIPELKITGGSSNPIEAVVPKFTAKHHRPSNSNSVIDDVSNSLSMQLLRSIQTIEKAITNQMTIVRE